MKIVDAVSEGGQTWMHRIRMQAQLAKIVFKISFLIGFLALAFLMYSIDKRLYIGSWYYIKASTIESVSQNSDSEI